MKPMIRVATVLAAVALAISCSDDTIIDSVNPTRSNEITFRTSVANNTRFATRNAGCNRIKSVKSEQIPGSDMWLITTEEAGIDGTTLGAKSTATRGAMVNNLTSYGAFKLYAYAYEYPTYSSFDEAIGATDDYISGIIASQTDDGTWNTPTPHYWLNDENKKMAFFGIAPTEIKDYNVTFTYTLEDDNAGSGTVDPGGEV